MTRKEHTPFYFNEEFDKVLRECDEARAEELWIKYQAGRLVSHQKPTIHCELNLKEE